MSENQISNVEFAQVFSERVSNLLRESNKPQKCDPIDRQAAIAEFNCCELTPDGGIDANYAIDFLEQLPSVQPVHDCDTCRYNRLEWDEEPCDSCTAGGENNHWKPSAQPEIIRCKDCLMHGVCRFEQGLGLDGYCSQAERRTDGTNAHSDIG